MGSNPTSGLETLLPCPSAFWPTGPFDPFDPSSPPIPDRSKGFNYW